MSFKHLSLSRKSRTLSAEERALEDVLHQLGLESHRADPLDLAAMLGISTWNPGDPPALAPVDLPHTFLRRLWLLSPQARSPHCHTQADPFADALEDGGLPGLREDTQCAVNPLDLVTAVYMSASNFLRQEMTVRMAQCGFAVPLLLPPCGPGGQATLLLWPLRAVVRTWRPHLLAEPDSFIKGDMTSAQMPLLSFVRLGRCSVSKSQVVNHILGGFQGPTSCFLHKGMDGGQLPRRLSNGLVEVSWYLPSGDRDLDIFHEPVMVANLRGDAAMSTATFKAQLRFLSRNSSVLFVFCEALGEKEHLQLASFRDSGSQILLIMCSQEEGEKEEEEGKKEVALQKLAEDLELPEGAVLSCSMHDGEELLANRLSEAVRRLLRDSPRLLTLAKAADTTHELSIASDEGKACRMALTEAEEVLKGIEEQGASRYKEEQLPLQGQLWKRLVQLQNEESRLKDSVNSAQRKQELLTEKENLCQERREYKMTAAMRSFIAALSTPDKLKRAFFLSWMRLRLNAMIQQSQPITEKQEAITVGETQELHNQEMKQPEVSLGLEHFTREMGLVFELSILSRGSGADGVLCFPALAADLLLYGLPFELLDGDASTITLQWVGSVLSEVHRRLLRDSRVRVVTILGLHTSSNAAVISALLGVTFPVGDNQNTRGASMLLLAVPGNLRRDLACDFLLLINTEGLKCPGMVQDEDSVMQDNRLATYAMGLSDVTLLNLPADGEVEMRNTLLMAVNALLRVKETGRMPIFQAVAQGNGMDTELLLQLLGRATQILSAGDKNLAEPSFDNLLELEATSSKQCLQGPWQNSHPMAPISHGYSKAVMDHKQNLLDTLRKCVANTPSISLLDFLEHVRSLWDTVLFEKFPFELKSIDVGEAFCDLCREFSHWEQTFLEYMGSWVEGAVQLILTFKESPLVMGDPNGHQTLEELLSSLKMQAAKEVESEAIKVLSNLEEYFKKGKGHSSLVKKYRDNFTNSVGMLKQQVACEVSDKIETAKWDHNIVTQKRGFQNKLEAALEVRLGSILECHKAGEPILEDKQLQEEFDQVWDESISKLALMPLEIQDIISQVLQQLKENLSNRGISKHLDKLAEVTSYESSVFIIDEEHFGYRSRMKQMFTVEDKMQAQALADRVIEDCRKYVLRKKSLKRDYLDSYTIELLKIVDKALDSKQFDIRSRFEVELKVHICGSAAHSFQEMHKNITRESDPLIHLEKAREQHFWKFVYNFRKRDQCQQAARAFTTLCLKPALLDYVYSALRRLIQKQLLCSDGQQYRSPQAFHFNLLRELLQEDSFESFLDYLLSSESFIRRRIQDHVDEYLSGIGMLQAWMQQHLEQISGRMVTAVRQTGACWNESSRTIRLLLERVCDSLEDSGEVNIPQDALQGPLFQITTPGDRFIKYLEKSLAEMLQSLKEEFSQAGGSSSENIANTLQALPVQPQDDLYLRVRGCEEQCPFCKAPCEVWGVDHTVHHALLHRPKGLVSYTCATSNSLSHTICPSDIAGENLFCNRDTDRQFLCYRDYRSVYPNWIIPEMAPGSHGVSVYWKYVLVRHNSRFAKEYQCGPAQLPEEWLSITQEEAIQSLRQTFGIE
ncbi:hypothetical protein SKAU_G00090560 [Synaphobranchus kaupii]|uniref:VLIG-type G domain-containing protein n=1 Tax=Synaphobranchus kaupii TaxID=118154 RepID=A0A9Q1FXF2_SYNKA|nr:hypothetical protein SKAU_G00090560 [Synaphobranchus kaupii]